MRACRALFGPLLSERHPVPRMRTCVLRWRSGYLPGEDYGYLPFFFGLAVVYLALGVTWMIVCMAYIKVRSDVGS